MNKINLYVFSQIVKSCTLVFFIFVSIAWLMQLSRLFQIMNNLQIKFIDIFGLSIWLIPNLTNVTLPFIIIFGLVLAFVKLDKDREIIAIYSLGLTLNAIKKPLYLIVLLTSILYFFLSFFLSPFTYDIYKKNEFKIRNSVEFDNLNISNFIELDKNLIIDFDKRNNSFYDILINFNEENKEENLIFAEKGSIKKIEDKLVFTLINGFKLMINNTEIEKLKFDKYKIEFPNITKEEYKKYDKNTLNLFELINDNNKTNNKILFHRQFDIYLILSLFIFFYYNIIRNNNYSLKNIITFISLAIFSLTIDNFLENYSVEIRLLIILNIINLLFAHIIIKIIRMVKINV